MLERKHAKAIDGINQLAELAEETGREELPTTSNRVTLDKFDRQTSRSYRGTAPRDYSGRSFRSTLETRSCHAAAGSATPPLPRLAPGTPNASSPMGIVIANPVTPPAAVQPHASYLFPRALRINVSVPAEHVGVRHRDIQLSILEKNLYSWRPQGSDDGAIETQRHDPGA